MLSEVKLVTLGVSDLDRACAFYADALGYRVVERGTVDPALAPLWRFDAGAPGRYAVIAADDSGLGRLRLLQFEPPGRRLWTQDNLYTGTDRKSVV